jgi:hypothetical protein
MPQLDRLFDSETSDAATRCRVAWMVGRIGSPAAQRHLFARLGAHGLDERLAVARALGFAAFTADATQTGAVWAEIETQRDIAALLEAGAALAGTDERIDLLRSACREARARERERLFLLLAMVLPRERIVQVAWRHARGAEEERAYALEVLDTLLPALRKTVVLAMLDAAPKADSATLVQNGTLEAFMARLDSPLPASAWIYCCALVAGQSSGALPPDSTLRRWAAAPEAVLAATARANLELTQPGDTRMLTIEKVMMLRSVPLFAGVPNQFLADIAEVLGERETEAGEVVIREGEKGDQLYVIAQGAFEVAHRGRLVARLGPRQVFGELAVLDPEPRAATVTSTGEGLLFSLDHEHLDDLMAGNMEIAHGFIRMLCRRIRETNEAATSG